MQKFVEIISNDRGNDTKDWPERLSVTHWSVLHECIHCGLEEERNEILTQIRDSLIYAYNFNDCDFFEPVILGFPLEDSDELQGKLFGLVGADNYELKDGKYEPIDVKMIGGINLNNPEQVENVVRGTLGRIKGPKFN